MSLAPLRLFASLHTRLMLVVVVLVFYGSLFPFHYQSHEPAWADLSLLFTGTGKRSSLSDLIGNVLLFLPYGLLMASSRMGGRVGSGLVAGAALAGLVQYLQFWFPDRDPSGLDAATNVLGILLGMVVGRMIPAHLWPDLTSKHGRPHIALLTSGLMLLWLLDRWFPLVPSLDVQNIKNGLKPLLDWSQIGWLDVLRHLTGWLVFLRLARYSPLKPTGLPVLLLMCGLAVAVEPVFLTNTLGPDNLIGFVLACVSAPWFRRGPASLAMLVLVLLLNIVLSALEPFDFTWAGSFEWVPFAGWLKGDPLTAIPTMIEKTYEYGSLVFLLRYLGLSHKATCWTVGLLSLTLEILQQGLPGRTPEITDPLMMLVFAWLMKPVFDRGSDAVQTTASRH